MAQNYDLSSDAKLDGGRQRIVVVLAMHRSGSSAITRGLKVLGVDLGGNLMEAIEGENDKGFWEDVDICRFNERLLAKAESAWHKLAPLDAVLFEGPAYANERRDAAELLVGKLKPGVVFGFKDPRTAVLLPFWRCIFDDLELDARYIVTVRNPLETAASLNKRGGFPMLKGTTLWAKHVIEAIRATTGEPRVFVAFDRLLRDPEGELLRIAAILGLDPPDEAALAEFRDDFLEAGLRHNFVGRKELARSGVVPPFVIDLYEMVSGIAASPAEGAQDVDADAWYTIELGYAQAAPFLYYADFIDEKRAVTIDHSKVLDAKLKETVEALQKAASAQEIAEKAREDVDETLRKTRGELDEIRASNAAEIGILAEQKTGAETLNEELLAKLEAHRDAEAAAVDRTKVLEGDLGKLRSEMVILAEQKAGAETLNEELLAKLEAHRDAEAAALKYSQEVESTLERSVTALEEARSAQSIAEGERADLGEELSRAHAALAEEKSRAEQHSAELKREMQAERAAHAATRNRIRSLQDTLAAQQGEKNALRKDFLLLRAEVNATRREQSHRPTAPMRAMGRFAQNMVIGFRKILGGSKRDC